MSPKTEILAVWPIFGVNFSCPTVKSESHYHKCHLMALDDNRSYKKPPLPAFLVGPSRFRPISYPYYSHPSPRAIFRWFTSLCALYNLYPHHKSLFSTLTTSTLSLLYLNYHCLFINVVGVSIVKNKNETNRFT